MTEPRIAEISWYKKNGKYSARIMKDSTGLEFVVGDWGWNRNGKNPPEFIEDKMRRDGVYAGQGQRLKGLGDSGSKTSTRR